MNPSRKTYYRSNRVRNLLLAGVLVAYAIFVDMPLIYLILMLALAALVVYATFKVRLITSPEGIEYHQLGYTLRSSWSNISHVGRAAKGFTKIEGLILHEPGQLTTNWLSRAQNAEAAARGIPLSIFTSNWANSELGKDLQQYAPNLIAEEWNPIVPSLMQAAVLRQFGGPENLKPETIRIPTPDPGEVLIKVEYAGVGEWDPFEREGGYAQMLGLEPQFPYMLGSEGAGTIAALGDGVDQFKHGDAVYAPAFLNPKGGFYAEYAAVPADLVSPLPAHLTAEQASAIAGVGLTALRGLQDVLALQPGESILILGASGGVGHLAVQIAKAMGARVLAAASEQDGLALAKQLGADAVIDGYNDDLLAAARSFAPAGLDAALLTAGGEAAEAALQALRPGGRAACPNGVQPAPQPRPEITLTGYNGEPDAQIVRRLHALITSAALTVHVSQVFPLKLAAEAHRALEKHTVGKIVLRVGGL